MDILVLFHYTGREAMSFRISLHSDLCILYQVELPFSLKGKGTIWTTVCALSPSHAILLYKKVCSIYGLKIGDSQLKFTKPFMKNGDHEETMFSIYLKY